MSHKREEIPKVSVGMPVYNGEEFISKRIKNILEQSFEDFELIISDNASEDKTGKICMEFANIDNRIHYFHQNKNMGPIFNFQFVLMQSKGHYFVWAGVDDEWDKDFLKECIKFLEKNVDYVGCIGQVEKYGESNIREFTTSKKVNKIVDRLRWSKYGPHEAVGSYDDKIRSYLKASSAQSLYGMFKTDFLKKGFIPSLFLGVDLAIILNVLKFGNFHVIDKKMIKFYVGGQSSKGIIKSTEKLGHSFFGRIFPYYPFSSWFWNNLDKRIFLKNLDLLIKINVGGTLALIYDIILRVK